MPAIVGYNERLVFTTFVEKHRFGEEQLMNLLRHAGTKLIVVVRGRRRICQAQGDAQRRQEIALHPGPPMVCITVISANRRIGLSRKPPNKD